MVPYIVTRMGKIGDFTHQSARIRSAYELDNAFLISKWNHKAYSNKIIQQQKT